MAPSWRIASEIGLGVRELGLIAIARGGHLVELRLVGTRIDLREQVAGMHGLPFGEVDLTSCPWIWLRTTTVL